MESTWRHEKAMLALPILVDVAKEEGIITYGELGEAIGVIPVMVGYVVGYVRDYVCCEDKRVKYPLINLLVVNKDDTIRIIQMFWQNISMLPEDLR